MRMRLRAASSFQAASIIFSAAARYFSVSIGGMRQHVADVVEAVADVVGGEVVGGWKSTPTRSRMVLSYSARLSRRMVTRPGSFGPLGLHVDLEHVRVDPGVDRVEFGLGRFRLALRRHHAAVEIFVDLLPNLGFGEGAGLVLERFEVEVAARLGAVMAPDAVLGEDRLHVAEGGLSRGGSWRAGVSPRSNLGGGRIGSDGRDDADDGRGRQNATQTPY